MFSKFNSIWMLYVCVTLSFESKKLFALECYKGRTKVTCDHQCGYRIDLHKLQNLYWDLFLENQLEGNQAQPNDEVDVPDKFIVEQGCMETEVTENSHMPLQCKKEGSWGILLCFCNTKLCNGPGKFKAPRNLIRNGGQRKLYCLSTTSPGLYTECDMNQLCTIQLDVGKVDNLIKTSDELPWVWEKQTAVFYGCTEDPNPLLLTHTKDVCAFSGDITNQSIWTCRCNLDECNSKARIFLTDDLSAFRSLPQYDETRIRCLKSSEHSSTTDKNKPLLDEDFGWCKHNEVCTIRIDLIKKKELNQSLEGAKPDVYQGCYNRTPSEGSLIVSTDGDDCRNIETNLNLAWRCVCTTDLCNWYRHSRLTNTVPRTKKTSLHCYDKQNRDSETDMKVIDASAGRFCALYVSFAAMNEQYKGYANETKLEESATSLEEPLSVNHESVVYQTFIADALLENSKEVGKDCKFTFTEKRNNESLWVCLCNVSLCNAMKNVRFMPNDLRRDKPPQTTTTTDGPNRGVADKKKAQILWIILVAKILLEM